MNQEGPIYRKNFGVICSHYARLRHRLRQRIVKSLMVHSKGRQPSFHNMYILFIACVPQLDAFLLKRTWKHHDDVQKLVYIKILWGFHASYLHSCSPSHDSITLLPPLRSINTRATHARCDIKNVYEVILKWRCSIVHMYTRITCRYHE